MKSVFCRLRMRSQMWEELFESDVMIGLSASLSSCLGHARSCRLMCADSLHRYQRLVPGLVIAKLTQTWSGQLKLTQAWSGQLKLT